MIRIVLLLSLLLATLELVSMSVESHQIGCFSDFFKKNSEYLIKAFVVESSKNSTGYASLSLGTLSKDIITQLDFSLEEGVSVLPYNSNNDQELEVCIQNLSDSTVYFDVGIKSLKEFNLEDESVQASQFNALDELSHKVLMDAQDSYLTWVNTEKNLQKMIENGTSFESRTTIFSTLTILVIFVLGMASTFIIKKELRKNKIN